MAKAMKSGCGNGRTPARPKKLNIDEARIGRYGKLYDALSDPLRLRILSILSVQSLCVCVIKEIVVVPDSKLSYHLSILKGAGLVSSRRDGNWIMYSLTKTGRKYASELQSGKGD
ncbi:MAG: metalloregulator ArsR/SmtB family transcription factor [Methanobacteriota archaeon]